MINRIKPLSAAIGSAIFSSAICALPAMAGEVNSVISDVSVGGTSIRSTLSVKEGDTLSLTMQTFAGELVSPGENVTCTLSGRINATSGSGVNGSDISFQNEGRFSYGLSFDESGALSSETDTISATVNRDSVVEEDEQFSVIIEEESVDITCTGSEAVTFNSLKAGFGSYSKSNELALDFGYAFSLYNVTLVDGAIVEEPTEVPPSEGELPFAGDAAFLKSQLDMATSISIRNAHTRTRSIARELARRRRDEGGFSADNFSIKLNGNSFSLGQYRSNANDDGASSPVRWGGFLSGSIEAGNTDSDHPTKLEFGSSMMTAGVDMQLPNWVVGMAVSLASSDADIESVSKATEVSQSGISAFASYYLDTQDGTNLYLDVILSSSTSTYDFTRPIDMTSSVQTDTDGDELGLAIGLGYEGRFNQMDYSLFMLYD